MGQKIMYILPVLLFLGLVVIAGIALTSGKDPSKIQSPLIGQPLPAFDADGFTHADVKGPAIINFFASWCIPCEAEHPVLKTLAQDTAIYGISYKDTLENRDKFLERLGNPFTKTGHDPDGKAAIAFGVYGMPTSLIIDRDNIIRYRHDAPLLSNDIPKLKEYLQ